MLLTLHHRCRMLTRKRATAAPPNHWHNCRGHRCVLKVSLSTDIRPSSYTVHVVCSSGNISKLPTLAEPGTADEHLWGST